ncbi:MAG: TetR/AcrR family transcriptional regulator [Deltaproteobacteria bacterium]
MSEKILDVAQDFIMERGYKAFSYKDLSKEIGIKTSSIHYYFPSKGDLGKTLTERFIQNVRESLELIDSTTENPKEKIKKYIQVFHENLKAGDRVCFCAMLASDYANLPEEVQKEVINLIQLHERWLTKVLESGIRNKVFKFKGKPEDKAKSIFSALEGSTISSRAFADSERIKLAEDMILNSIT